MDEDWSKRIAEWASEHETSLSGFCLGLILGCRRIIS
jgi:hypothetical protein